MDSSVDLFPTMTPPTATPLIPRLTNDSLSAYYDDFALSHNGFCLITRRCLLHCALSNNTLLLPIALCSATLSV